MRLGSTLCIVLGLSLASTPAAQAEPPIELEREVVVPSDEFAPVPIEPNSEPVVVAHALVNDEPEQPSIPPDKQPPPLPTRCKTSKRCRGMTASGILLATVGLAAVGTGIGLLLGEDQPIPDEPAYVISTRPAGLVTLTLGAGVTLTAVLMLVAARQAFSRVEPRRALRFDAEGLHF